MKEIPINVINVKRSLEIKCVTININVQKNVTLELIHNYINYISQQLI
jgi:hypothetical protein